MCIRFQEQLSPRPTNGGLQTRAFSPTVPRGQVSQGCAPSKALGVETSRLLQGLVLLALRASGLHQLPWTAGQSCWGRGRRSNPRLWAGLHREGSCVHQCGTGVSTGASATSSPHPTAAQVLLSLPGGHPSFLPRLRQKPPQASLEPCPPRMDRKPRQGPHCSAHGIGPSPPARGLSPQDGTWVPLTQERGEGPAGLDSRCPALSPAGPHLGLPILSSLTVCGIRAGGEVGGRGLSPRPHMQQSRQLVGRSFGISSVDGVVIIPLTSASHPQEPSCQCGSVFTPHSGWASGQAGPRLSLWSEGPCTFHQDPAPDHTHPVPWGADCLTRSLLPSPAGAPQPQGHIQAGD